MSEAMNWARLHVELVREDTNFPTVSARRAKDVFALLREDYGAAGREYFLALPLDVQNRVIGVHVVSMGTLTSSLVHPREVFQPAILASAAAVIVAHNHPSGDPDPSQADREVTRRLIRCGHLLGIPLLDHVVFGQNEFRSLRTSMDFSDKLQGATL